MATYTVDLSDIDLAETQLKAVTDKLLASAQELKNKVDQYAAANAGAAIENYGAVQQQWDLGMNQVREGAAKAGQVLHMIGETYHEGDTAGASLFVA
ncbi:uncharacterized protein YukE [Micromonospora pisi]|uniref:Uncharacterized protein YukE n=1 Tax=Micromonospora pisi TaxID=589240 RepID=A0A495JCK5_9ACTN|nr:WXG100 family type VII secretion target [Micromonospora pisi]RKR86740.1 uncharacterized protein YukE [Micromonospora pisi]